MSGTDIKVVNAYISNLEENYKKLVLDHLVLGAKLTVAEERIAEFERAANTPTPKTVEAPCCGLHEDCIGCPVVDEK